MIMNIKELMKKGVAFTGLMDVVGGVMWFCYDPNYKSSMPFWTKKECEAYIRKIYVGEDRALLLRKLRECKGRAFRYA